MFISAFFANLMPSCLLLGIFAIMLQYIADKYLFLRKRNNRFNLGDELGNEMIEQLEYVIPCYAFSNLIFNYIFYSGVDIMTILGLVIGVIHAALPMGEYNEIICKVFYILKLNKIPDAHCNKELLTTVQHTFTTNYSQENPATSEI